MSISGLYFVCLVSMAVSGYMSWQYVNSLSCIVGEEDGANGVWL